ncbi:MAG: glycosyltransferase [Eubacterium sp.]|nr:glycosyltransferase [Eubacterium sp.]
MEIKISVIIPIYNMEMYLQECLDTVLSQTLQEIEVICINDGSQDSSEEIIRKNIEKDPRIKLISQENRGVAYARNAGIRSASGEFVIFIDPDDWYPDNDVLECLYRKAKEENVLICGGSFSEVQPGGLVTEFTGNKKKYAFEKDGILDFKEYQFDYGYHRFIYQLDFLKSNDIYFPPYIRYQDPPFFVKAMICAGKFYAMKKITYRYRVGHQNINWTEKRLIDLLQGLRDNLKMSGEAGLEELHGLTIERLGKSYINMYARTLKEASPELFRLLFEIDRCINRDLIADDPVAIKYADASCDIMKRAIVLESQKSESEIKKQKAEIKELNTKIKGLNRKVKNVEKKYTDMKNSKSFRCGRVMTYIPRKIRDISGKGQENKN